MGISGFPERDIAAHRHVATVNLVVAGVLFVVYGFTSGSLWLALAVLVMTYSGFSMLGQAEDWESELKAVREGDGR